MAPFNFDKTDDPKALVGVFGGSGFYNFLESTETVKVETLMVLPVLRLRWVKLLASRLPFCRVMAWTTAFRLTKLTSALTSGR